MIGDGRNEVQSRSLAADCGAAVSAAKCRRDARTTNARPSIAHLKFGDQFDEFLADPP
jgi:hypothetical protein